MVRLPALFRQGSPGEFRFKLLDSGLLLGDQLRSIEDIFDGVKPAAEEKKMVVAGEGVGPSIRGQEPRVIPFHHPAIVYISSYIDILICCQP